MHILYDSAPRRFAWMQFLLASLGLVGLLTNDFLGRWVTPLTAAAWIVAAMCVAAVFFPALRRIITLVFDRLAWLILPMLLLLWLRLLWADRLDRLPSLWAYLPFALLWVWFVIGFLFSISEKQPMHKPMLLLLRLVVMAVIILVMVEVLLLVFAKFLPDELIARSVFLDKATEQLGVFVGMPPQAPIRNYRWAGDTYEFTLYNTDGDLYRLTCLQPPPREALYDVRVSYNAQGFRETTSGKAELVIAGDSFTQAGWFNEPFWMNITPNVLAMGISGTGSLEEQMLLEAFAPEREPEVVVMAYFEGNDLQETWRFKQGVEDYQKEQLDPSLTEIYRHFRPLRFLSVYGTALWLIDKFEPLNEVAYGDCPYPVTDAYGNQLAFFDKYVAMSTVDTDELRDSEVFAATRDAILKANAQTQAMNATFVLMFIPTKFHVHWQGLVDADLIPLISQHIPAFQITENGFDDEPGVSDDEKAARLMQNVDNQRTLLAELAAENDILFLDLTPAFQAAAAKGESLYGYGDTHWSLEGSDFVRERLRQFLHEHGLLLSGD